MEGVLWDRFEPLWLCTDEVTVIEPSSSFPFAQRSGGEFVRSIVNMAPRVRFVDIN